MATFAGDIVASADAAEENLAGGTPSLDSSDLELSYEGGTAKMVGLRWPSVSVPKDATIDSAFIQFHADETNSETQCDIIIHGEAADDPGTFTTDTDNITGRTKTDASVNWNNLPTWTVDDRTADQKTPDIAAIIQELVNRAGWNTGQAMVLFVADNGSTNSARRVADPDDADAGGNPAPELTINYTAAGGANPKGVLGMPFHGPFGGPI